VITAADSNILFDVLLHDLEHEQRSEAALKQAGSQGNIVIGGVVYGELAGAFSNASDLDRFLEEIGVRLVPSGRAALYEGGQAWIAYRRTGHTGIMCMDCGIGNRPVCRKCGSGLRGKQHLLADFLIGGHAMIHADRLLTRDRRHFRKYFPGLKLTHP
jgi:predicted nucleic acid-binding protein